MAGVCVPARALMDKIIRLYLSPIIVDILQIVILNNTDFLAYKGRHSKDEAMANDEAAAYLRNIIGSRNWVGFPAVIRATPLMLWESKAQISGEFIHMSWLEERVMVFLQV